MYKAGKGCNLYNDDTTKNMEIKGMELIQKDKINSIIEPYHETNKNPCPHGAEIPVGSNKQKTINYTLDI